MCATDGKWPNRPNDCFSMQGCKTEEKYAHESLAELTDR